MKRTVCADFGAPLPCARMDFKAALQAEIEAKKRQLDKFGKNGSSVKVSEIERQKEEEYLAKQRELDSQREVK